MVGQPPGARLKPLVKLGESGNDCMEWIGSVNKTTGYGKKQWLGRSVLAHRWVWELFFGPIPEGRVINHLCGNRRCVNPAHLELTDQAGNCRHGKGAKLNAHQVLAIRSMPVDMRKANKNRLAQEYGVTASTIHDIWQGKSWKDIKPGATNETD